MAKPVVAENKAEKYAKMHEYRYESLPDSPVTCWGVALFPDDDSAQAWYQKIERAHPSARIRKWRVDAKDRA